ncbi:MAG: TlpA family protein disulfide reductase [Chloroflexi bacterium]|nr:TlpA family protein disulfide reductase [Chloroflexota bacterium]
MSLDQRVDSPAGGEAELPEWLEEVSAGARGEEAGQVKQRFSTFGVTAILLIVGLLAVIGYALYQRSLSTPTEGPAPTFSVTTFDGETLQLADLRGQAVVINFWASYCLPCREEAPMLERVWQDYRDQGVVFLGINTDDIERDAREYMAQYGVTYPNAPDKGGRIEDDYRITGIPETFVVNTEGEIVQHFLAQPREADLRAKIDEALRG